MYVEYNRLVNQGPFKVIGWHEDTTRQGNYVLTIRTALGRTIPAVERSDLTAAQIEELKATVPKDSTGL